MDAATAAGRPFDAPAVDAIVRRLARRPEPPWLHAEVARRMADKLRVIKREPRRILDWWSALGAGGALLDAAYPQAERVAVEPAAVLRAHPLRHRPWWRRLARAMPRATVLDESGELPGQADLLWANMMLPAVADPPALFTRWHGLLALDGFVMFSALGPGTLRELRALYAALGWGPPAAEFVDMHDYGDMLVQAGFADPVMDQETITLRWSGAEGLLAELRALGGNAHPQRARGWRTPRWRVRLHEALETLRGPDGRLGLTFEVAYGHAFKGRPRARADAPTTVPLEDMRELLRRRGRIAPAPEERSWA
jgi:malonyl-CoA O-methyltransferase